MTEIDIAYMAGAMDADGCFRMSKITIRGSTTYSEVMTLGQIYPTVPNILKAAFGGHIQVRRHKKWKTMYYWVAQTKIAASAAKTLLPYLHLKKRQAEILCELRESKQMKWSDRRNVRTFRTNPEIVARRIALFHEIGALNQAASR